VVSRNMCPATGVQIMLNLPVGSHHCVCPVLLRGALSSGELKHVPCCWSTDHAQSFSG